MASEASEARPRRTNAVGRPRTVSDAYMQRLKELVSHDPREFSYPFRRWTAHWLNQHLSQEIGVAVSDRHINRLLKQMGLSTRTSYASTSLLRRQNKGLSIQIADLQGGELPSVGYLPGEYLSGEYLPGEYLPGEYLSDGSSPAEPSSAPDYLSRAVLPEVAQHPPQTSVDLDFG